MEQMEVEIKFRVPDAQRLQSSLAALGFTLKTPRTFERNSLYDTPSRTLLNSGRLLRLRHYGDRWVLTFKAKPKDDDPAATHKSRIEIETALEDGEAAAAIFDRLGYVECFVYEKWRTEWEDATGHLTVDETAIGVFAELEGPPEWIDSAAARLQVPRSEYITASYGRLFESWCAEHCSPARNLTFEEVAAAPATR